MKDLKYEAYLLFTKNDVFIKSANMMWYQIQNNNAQVKLIGGQNVPFKEGIFTVYSKFQGISSLIRAPPLNLNSTY